VRNPKRIDEILAAIRRIWMLNPDLRLMQLLLNATGDGDHYYMEDETLLIKILRLYEGGSE
jgi:uncharacterized protein YihD (DUF1040 family)